MYSVFGMFLFSLLKTPPYSSFSLFSFLVSFSSISRYFQDGLDDYGSQDDEVAPSTNTAPTTQHSYASSSSGGSTAPPKKRNKSSSISLQRSTHTSAPTGFPAESCKVICCDKMQGKRQTVAKSFEELTDHIRSILNGNDVSDILATDWKFLEHLVNLDILKSTDFCLYKNKQILEEELSFWESLNDQIKNAAAGPGQIPHNKIFLSVLEQTQAPLLSRTPILTDLIQSTKTRLEFLLGFWSFIVYVLDTHVINCACVIDFVACVVHYVLERSLL
jgi:hypothetical protein